MKKVLFDIMHPAHVNFFVNLVKKLESNNIDVEIITLDRGPVVKMVKKEYPEIASKVVGKYSPNILGVFLKTGFIRACQILGQIFGKKYDAFVGVAAFQLGFVGKFSRTKSIIIYDDPEHKVCFNLSKWIANKFYLPRFCGVSAKNIFLFNSLKEWAYLSPKYFQPNSDVLQQYDLKPFEYIFIREVDNKSLNYRNQDMSVIEGLHASALPTKVVLSLENKSRRGIYKDWVILEEPVEDIHSLMYFSKAVISNGDSMAREGAMLGTHSIYCGDRQMAANTELIDRGLLQQINDLDQLKNVLTDKILTTSRDQRAAEQETIRAHLMNEWDDVNEILYEEITR